MLFILLDKREIFREAVFLWIMPFEAAFVYLMLRILRYCCASPFFFSAIRLSNFFALVFNSDIRASLRLRFFASALRAL